MGARFRRKLPAKQPPLANQNGRVFIALIFICTNDFAWMLLVELMICARFHVNL